MAWASVPRKESPPRISACRARRLREEGDEPDHWARAVRGAKATRGGLSGWLAGPAGSGCSERGADALGPCCVSGRRGHGRGPSAWALGARAAERAGAKQAGVERDARVRAGPNWAGSFAGPRGEREKGLGWVGFGFGFGLGFLFSFLFSISTSNKV